MSRCSPAHQVGNALHQEGQGWSHTSQFPINHLEFRSFSLRAVKDRPHTISPVRINYSCSLLRAELGYWGATALFCVCCSPILIKHIIFCWGSLLFRIRSLKSLRL